MNGWQARIIERIREFPEESLESRAAFLKVSAPWLRAVTGSDAFRSLLISQGLAGSTASSPTAAGHSSVLPLPTSEAPGIPQQATPAPASEATQAFQATQAFVADPAVEDEGGASGTRSRHVQRPGNWLKETSQYTHDGMIDALIARPAITRAELAQMFGMNLTWVYKVLASEAFREAFDRRKREIVDPTLALSVEETFSAIVMQAADLASERIQAKDSRMAARVLDVGARFFAGIARNQAPAVQNFIAIVPAKDASSDSWARTYAPQAIPSGS